MQNLILSIFSLYIMACGSPVPKTNTKDNRQNYSERGKASYYHDKFHGKKTASGELYDKTKYTAAHKTLPFGTVVKLVMLDNPSDTIEVKINDRGPFTKGRIIDISRAAADRIGLIRKGIAEVEIISSIPIPKGAK